MEHVRPVFGLHCIFLCELNNSHSSVVLALTRFIRTQDGDDMQSTVSTKKFENHWPRTHVYSSSHHMRQN